MHRSGHQVHDIICLSSSDIHVGDNQQGFKRYTNLTVYGNLPQATNFWTSLTSLGSFWYLTKSLSMVEKLRLFCENCLHGMWRMLAYYSTCHALFEIVRQSYEYRLSRPFTIRYFYKNRQCLWFKAIFVRKLYISKVPEIID